MIFRQRGVAVDARHLFEQRTGQRVVAVARPIGERRDHASQPPVAVGLDQLALRQRNASLAVLDRPIAQHHMREIDIELVRRHIRALRHEAHVAERAGVGDFLVIGRRHRVELAALRIVDQIEQPRKRVAQIEASPTGVADVEDAVHLGFGLRPVGKVRIFPRDRDAAWGPPDCLLSSSVSRLRGHKKGRRARRSAPPSTCRRLPD